ncbi:helix-turn-helix transcriptional regulator [Arenivirga flava]|uniref:HTH cro/C1-type domain-containing protein n=1 Tax=Arenivirga flava TaxID=1930060 RepID=A0AA37UTR4_9MICO|nr:transcriptional regulator [Arenivirga flava]GMA28207.1 hypothetical protein GCM10025874_14600 [Arenivirga flava]
MDDAGGLGQGEALRRHGVRLDGSTAEERRRLAGGILELRRASGMTQEQLASAAAVNRRTVGNIERGAFTPQPDVLRRVLRVLGVPTEADAFEPEVEAWLMMLGGLVSKLPEPRRDQVMRQEIARIAAELRAEPVTDVGGAPQDAPMNEIRYAADAGNALPDEDLRTP